jgi:CelD/BcsL family acetyltransferase involved in cellulose biosynthesis
VAPFIELLVSEFAFSFEFAASLAAGFANRRLRRGNRVIDIDIAEGGDAVATAAADWRHIERAGGVATPFQTLAVGEAAAEVHVRRGELPRIVVGRDDGRPAALFATVVSRCAGVRSVRFLGDPLNQYGDIIAAPGAAREHVEAAWHAAADPAVAKFIHLRKVRDDSWLAPVLDRTATVVDAYEAPFVALDRGRIPVTNDTRQFRRSQRRLAEGGALHFEILRGCAAQPALREALALTRA